MGPQRLKKLRINDSERSMRLARVIPCGAAPMPERP